MDKFPQDLLNSVLTPSRTTPLPIPLHTSNVIIPKPATRPPPRRRNMDQRRHAAKLASRVRRNNESDLVKSLGQTLTIYQPQEQQQELDKPCILRLAVTDLKLRELFGGISRQRESSTKSFPDMEELLNGGFLIVIAESGSILYVSETVSGCLGLHNWEISGKSMYQYVDPGDWPDLVHLLVSSETLPPTQAHVPQPRSAMMRFKCSPRAGFGIQARPNARTTIYFNGNMYPYGPAGTGIQSSCFIGVGSQIPHPADNDYPYPFISNRIFTTLRLADNARFLRTDENVQLHLHFTSSELSRLSWFELVHAQDAYMVCQRAKEARNKGQAHSDPFRLLVKGGGWVWVIGEAFKVSNSSSNGSTGRCGGSSGTNEAWAIFCRYIVISGIETREILSVAQLPSLPAPSLTMTTSMDSEDSCSPIETIDLEPELTTSSPMSQTEDEHQISNGDQCEDEDLKLLQSLTANVDFSTLPAFVQALDTLFDYNEEMCPSSTSSFSLPEFGSNISTSTTSNLPEEEQIMSDFFCSH